MTHSLIETSKQVDYIFSLLPEILLVFGLIVALLLSVSKRYQAFAAPVSAGALFVGLLHQFVLYAGDPELYSQSLFSASFVVDQSTVLFKGVILLCSFCIVLASDYFLLDRRLEGKTEFLFFILAATLGSCVLVSARDLILFFVSIETLALSTIAMIALSKTSSTSLEAGIKYLINGAVGSAFLLFGLALLYGLTGGQTRFDDIGLFISETSKSGEISYSLLALSMVLIAVPLGFKLALFPFHLWAADVYDGAFTPATAFLATASKVAGIAAFFNLSTYFFATVNFGESKIIALPLWAGLFALMAIASMIFGNLLGVRQFFRPEGSLKRVLAYSSIAQIGYIMAGLLIFDQETILQALVYLAAYTIVNLAAFICLLKIESWLLERGVEEAQLFSLKNLRGLAKDLPFTSGTLAICLASLAGVLPSILIAKFFLLSGVSGYVLSQFPSVAELLVVGSQPRFLSILPSGLALGLALAMVFSSVAAVYFYFLPIRMLYVDQSERSAPWAQRVLAIKPEYFAPIMGTMLLLLTIFLGFHPVIFLG